MEVITDVSRLEKIARTVRQDIIKMLTQAGSGHPGGSLSAVELLVALYFNVLRYRVEEPCWEERDRFILSKGHACPLHYAVLAQAGFLPREELLTLRKFGSRLQGHPACDKNIPGVEVSTGSLGQGLSVGVGMALGLRLAKRPSRVYVLLSDGEHQEGSTWEAMMAAGHYRLDNLVAIVDSNRLQIDGELEKLMGIEPLVDKYRSFRWEVLEIDGHSLPQIIAAYQKSQTIKDKPTAIIAHTIKGKGVSFMENVAGWHGKAPSKELAERALGELGNGG